MIHVELQKVDPKYSCRCENATRNERNQFVKNYHVKNRLPNSLCHIIVPKELMFP